MGKNHKVKKDVIPNVGVDVIPNDSIDNTQFVTNWVTSHCPGIRNVNNGFILTRNLGKAQGTFNKSSTLAKLVKVSKTQLGLIGFDLATPYNYGVMFFDAGHKFVPASIKHKSKHGYFGKGKYVVPLTMLKANDLADLLDLGDSMDVNAQVNDLIKVAPTLVPTIS